ncbi:unnamed protein product [Rhizophagus irregularis]|nr:unnamed protein product [Rhizophagus irregularis]
MFLLIPFFLSRKSLSKFAKQNEKELPGLRNGRLRREGTSWTSKWTLETRNEKELPGLQNGRLRQEGTSWTSKWTLETRRNAS